MSRYIKVLNELNSISQQFNVLIEAKALDLIEEIVIVLQNLGSQIQSNGIATIDDVKEVIRLKNEDPFSFVNTVYDNLHLLIEEYKQLLAVEKKTNVLQPFQYGSMDFLLLKNEHDHHQFIYETADMVKGTIDKLNHETEAVIMVGAGPGSLIKELEHKYQLLVVEPYEISGRILCKNMVCLFNESDTNSLLNNEFLKFVGLKTEIIFHPLYIPSKQSIRILKRIRNSFQQIQVDLNTRVSFTEKWYKQYFLNINTLAENFERIINIDSLKDFHKGERALMIAGGPSLEEAISYLKEAQKSYYIIAIGQVVKVLLENDIFPDYVVSIDSELANAHFFKDLEVNVPLIYPLQVNNFIPNHTKGPLVPYADNKVTKELLNYSNKIFDTGPSVAISAVIFMYYAGFDFIGLIGQDLALRNGEYYGASVKEKASNEGQLSKLTHTIELNNGALGKTTPVLLGFLTSYNALVSFYQDLRQKLVNYSEYGARIDGVCYESITNLKNEIIQKRNIQPEQTLLLPSVDNLLKTFEKILSKLLSLDKKISRYSNQRAISKQEFQKILREWDDMIELKRFKSHVMPLQIVNVLIIQNKIQLHNYFDQSSDVRLQIIKMMETTLQTLIHQLREYQQTEPKKQRI
ncbi:motility associated factor glycosyltransferase family protein [Exiguobacterium aurantiacum]|uniref:motility associated factor glycosyltransferase family protein n=1 Tax=Exiguobacterium aurantiacum TaxID=33987 RepID=UPI00384FF1BF